MDSRMWVHTKSSNQLYASQRAFLTFGVPISTKLATAYRCCVRLLLPRCGCFTILATMTTHDTTFDNRLFCTLGKDQLSSWRNAFSEWCRRWPSVWTCEAIQYGRRGIGLDSCSQLMHCAFTLESVCCWCLSMIDVAWSEVQHSVSHNLLTHQNLCQRIGSSHLFIQTCIAFNGTTSLVFTFFMTAYDDELRSFPAVCRSYLSGVLLAVGRLACSLDIGLTLE